MSERLSVDFHQCKAICAYAPFARYYGSELFPRRPRLFSADCTSRHGCEIFRSISFAVLCLSPSRTKDGFRLCSIQVCGCSRCGGCRRPGLTRTTYRNAQQSKNAELLTDLDVRGLKAVAEEHAPASPEKKKEPTKRAPKPKVEPLPRVSEDVEAAIKAREERGLRSSSRVKDKLLGVTATPAPSSVSFATDGEEETEYYEGGRKVRTGGGGALFFDPARKPSLS